LEVFAAIDIGSNAIRTLILKKEDNGHLTILKKSRASLRLGSDVFNLGHITNEKAAQMCKIFEEIQQLLDLYQVKKIRACATSAMREADNGNEVKLQIENKTNFKIELIDGDLEAKLIHNAVLSELHLEKKLSILVDIGGGSTEFTVSENGNLLSCKSFPIGAVRLLNYPNFFELSLAINFQILKAKEYLSTIIANRKIDAFIGTGGNFRRIGKINQKISGKAFVDYVSTEQMENVFQALNSLSHIERVQKFGLSDDRADVIIPAALLIKNINDMLDVSGIYIPKVGLKEGIALSLLNN
jgi:exopolyphosphatase/guanosine-5'-triphosphate,3'-diphosphate pyrophosphatase